MAADEQLADRIRARLGGRKDITERKMFGGLCFMIGGNMCCGVAKRDLMLRVGAENEPRALALAHARPCDFTGRPMTGMVLIGPDGYDNDTDLDRALDIAVGFAASLPPK